MTKEYLHRKKFWLQKDFLVQENIQWCVTGIFEQFLSIHSQE